MCTLQGDGHNISITTSSLRFFKLINLVVLGQLQQAGSLVSARGLLSCGMRVGSSSLSRDGTQGPCIGSVES